MNKNLRHLARELLKIVARKSKNHPRDKELIQNLDYANVRVKSAMYDKLLSEIRSENVWGISVLTKIINAIPIQSKIMNFELNSFKKDFLALKREIFHLLDNVYPAFSRQYLSFKKENLKIPN